MYVLLVRAYGKLKFVSNLEVDSDAELDLVMQFCLALVEPLFSFSALSVVPRSDLSPLAERGVIIPRMLVCRGESCVTAESFCRLSFSPLSLLSPLSLRSLSALSRLFFRLT